MYHLLLLGLIFLQAKPAALPSVPDTLHIYVDSPNVIRFLGKPTLISQYSTDSTIDVRLAAYLKEMYRNSQTLPRYLRVVYQTPHERALFKKGMETAVETALLDVMVYVQGRHVENATKKFPLLAQRSYD